MARIVKAKEFIRQTEVKDDVINHYRNLFKKEFLIDEEYRELTSSNILGLHVKDNGFFKSDTNVWNLGVTDEILFENRIVHTNPYVYYGL